MKGYIYRLHANADPAKGWVYNDPIFSKTSTLGACVPNLRRAVALGDWVFCISGRVSNYLPYVVGGFRVQEKINALEAYRRLPENRLHKLASGQVAGNIIVDSKGAHHKLDHHDGFAERVKNYLIGDKTLYVENPKSIEKAREQSLSVLSKIFDKPGNRSYDVVPRWRKMDEKQVNDLRKWLEPLSGK